MHMYTAYKIQPLTMGLYFTNKILPWLMVLIKIEIKHNDGIQCNYNVT